MTNLGFFLKRISKKSRVSEAFTLNNVIKIKWFIFLNIALKANHFKT